MLYLINMCLLNMNALAETEEVNIRQKSQSPTFLSHTISGTGDVSKCW